MNTRSRNLALVGAVFAMTVLFLWTRQAQPAPGPHDSRAPMPASVPTTATPTPASNTVLPQEEAPARNLHTHAVDVSWLNGFPPDAAPGDTFDIWVAWDGEVVKGPNVQILLKDVGLEKIAPPVTPEGPYVAYLIVTRAEARDLLYGTKYGALSVTQPAG